MTKKLFTNKLNDLTPKEWIKFQKSWFIHNPPRRQNQVMRHPAKYPETLAQEFIAFFTKQGGLVLDPMVGTGSTLVAALRLGRNSIGVELNPGYANLARQVVVDERAALSSAAAGLRAQVITGDAGRLVQYAAEEEWPLVDYVITSPPYWDMLRARGAKTQLNRRQDPGLDVFYSDHPDDLGNIADYNQFINKLVSIYTGLKSLLRPNAYLTIIVKNVKKGGRVYPLAWDLGRALSETYILKDERLWLQDDIRLAPYGLGNAWVSNTFHHYCLQFRNPA